MDDTSHIPKSLTNSSIICLFLLTAVLRSHCQLGLNETKFSVCGRPFNCGSVSNIYYPFWADNRPSYCGIFKLNCGPFQSVSIEIGSENFEVLDIDITNTTMALVRQPSVNDVCSQRLTNISLSPLFSYAETVQNITIFDDCPSGVSLGGNNFTCQNDGSLNAFYVDVNQTLFHHISGLIACKRRTLIQAPSVDGVTLEPDSGLDPIARLKYTLNGIFHVKYFAGGDECARCSASGGICGTSGVSKDQFSCLCPQGSDDTAKECSGLSPLDKGTSYVLSPLVFSLLFNFPL